MTSPKKARWSLKPWAGAEVIREGTGGEGRTQERLYAHLKNLNVLSSEPAGNQ